MLTNNILLIFSIMKHKEAWKTPLNTLSQASPFYEDSSYFHKFVKEQSQLFLASNDESVKAHKN